MLKAALALSVAVCILPPVCLDKALAQSAPLYINAVDIDVVPGQIDNYLAALKENAAASVHEPGCHEFNIAVSQKDANPEINGPSAEVQNVRFRVRPDSPGN
jgi:hypothetical protein